MKDFTSPWVWLSSNNLTIKLTGKGLENSVFDIGGGKPKIVPISLIRKLLSVFCMKEKNLNLTSQNFGHLQKLNLTATKQKIKLFGI